MAGGPPVPPATAPPGSAGVVVVDYDPRWPRRPSRSSGPRPGAVHRDRAHRLHRRPGAGGRTRHRPDGGRPIAGGCARPRAGPGPHRLYAARERDDRPAALCARTRRGAHAHPARRRLGRPARNQRLLRDYLRAPRRRRRATPGSSAGSRPPAPCRAATPRPRPRSSRSRPTAPGASAACRPDRCGRSDGEPGALGVAVLPGHVDGPRRRDHRRCGGAVPVLTLTLRQGLASGT